MYAIYLVIHSFIQRVIILPTNVPHSEPSAGNLKIEISSESVKICKSMPASRAWAEMVTCVTLGATLALPARGLRWDGVSQDRSEGICPSGIGVPMVILFTIT
jgi:hypothetical protein